jgi:transcriptional regulator with XRE-family HTH domain
MDMASEGMGEGRNPLAVTIGNRLRLAREAADLSQAQVALRLGITTSRYRSWELGNVLISLDFLMALTGVLKRSLCYFLGVADGELSDEDRLLLDYFQHTLSPSLRQSTLAVAKANFEHDRAIHPQ